MLVPTFTDGPDGVGASDLKYSMKNDADELPDVAVGRILGEDLTQVTNAVAKIVHYEQTPLTGPILTHATIAAYFQDDTGTVGTETRTFVQFAETVRNGLLLRGNTVDRVYTAETNQSPKKLNDGTDLPAALLRPTFGWNGTGADVSNDWNAGRFLIIHRDHGYPEGWGSPGFSGSDVNALTNTVDQLPVVMSINCASGDFDQVNDSFAQTALIKPNSGAVGVFGDTRNSPSWENTQLGFGLVDGLLPSVLPSEGPTSPQRVGDALINGKLRLAGVAPPATDESSRQELYLWHYYGDPSMQMWGGGSPPLTFDPGRFVVAYEPKFIPMPGDPPPYGVHVVVPGEFNGQAFALVHDGVVVGKAFAADGSVDIPALFDSGPPKPGSLAVALDKDGAAPLSIPVPDVPPVPTTLTQNCPAGATVNLQTLSGTLALTGHLAGAPAASKVTVTFTGGKPTRTATVPVTTDASGNWSASTPITRTDQGNWTITSAYAGAEGIAGSQAGPCTVPVSVG